MTREVNTLAQTAPHFILGTAGHIDHGKSTLVQALTGTDPDRLAEEKRRGITIELGFARLELDDGTVDVYKRQGCRRIPPQGAGMPVPCAALFSHPAP